MRLQNYLRSMRNFIPSIWTSFAACACLAGFVLVQAGAQTTPQSSHELVLTVGKSLVVNSAANMNYALYFSATSIGIDSVDSERHVGGRMGFFFPGSRVEVGGSWQRTLQDVRKNAFGFHMGWQPPKAQLNLRAEYARSYEGSGYWVEGAYRLSQAHFWQKRMRRTEVVSRMQQFFVGAIGPDGEDALGLPTVNMEEADFGVNYFLRDGMKGVFSYGRQLSSTGNFNQWSFGLAFRFLEPLGKVSTPSEGQ